MPAKKKTDVDAWAKKYFGSRKLHTDMTHGYAVLEAAGKGIRPKKLGLPEGFPRMEADSRGIKNRVEFLKEAERAFADGYSYALIVALKCCAYSSSAPVPAWIHIGLQDAIQLWELGYVDSLNDALGLALPSKPTRNFRLFHYQIFRDIENATAANVARSNPLYEEIGQHYGGISATTVETIYKDVKAIRVNTK